MTPGQSRGFSLVETVLALFLLVAAVLSLLGAFQQTLRNQARGQQSVAAQVAARNMMAEVRAWAREPTNFDGDWSRYNGRSLRQGDIEVRVQAQRRSLYSPCLSLESAWAGNARELRTSAVAVKVSASWDPLDPRARVDLVSYLGEPVRPVEPVLRVVQKGGPASPVPLNGIQEYSVQALDSNGRPLQDLHYRWQIKPLTGNATVLAGGPRDGTRARIQHVYTYLGRTLHVSGTILVQCHARYHGRELVGSSGPVILR